MLSGPRKWLFCSVSPALHEKHFRTFVDCDLFCWASQVNLRNGWYNLDLYKKDVLRTLLSEVAMPMFAVTEALLFVLCLL